MLISDGEAASDGLVELTDEMAARGVTLSTIGMGDADGDLLRLMADHGLASST